MSIDNGSISTHGPSAEDGQWTVYLLIRTPKSATVELDTMNGPISLYDVDGKLTAHAHNGPISLRNFSGDGEVSAVNGPISVEGSSGSLRIRTENGPINVDLRSEEHTSELQSLTNLVCRLLLEKKKYRNGRDPVRQTQESSYGGS